MKLKPTLKVAVAGLLTAAIAGAGLLGLAGAAFASQSAPSFEPDANAAAPYGNLVFYDANGNEVTSGTNLSSPFAYVVGTTPADANTTNASVYFANPQAGVVPGSWTAVDNEAGPTIFSPSLSGAPSDIAALAPTYPIVAASGANISSFLQSVGTANLPTATGYANTIEVRVTDSGLHGAGNSTSGTYWESDIGYNTTSSAITVDGTTVPADGWALLFPFSSATTTTLTTSATGGNLTTGSSITLTATVSPTEAGAVEFFDGTTLLHLTAAGAGPTFTYSYTPAQGSHSYTASFIPGDSPGDETGAGTASASISTESTSSAVPVTDNPPQTGTSTSLSASSNSIAYGASDTFTATVGTTDNSTTGVAGSVEFLDGTTAITGCTAQATTVTGAGTTVSPGVGTAICTTTSLPQGTDSITAVFTPTSNSYATSTSAAVGVTVVQTGTTTSLSASSNSIAYGASDTFTATVGTTDNSTTGVAGSVEFLDGTTAITGCTAQATAVTGAGTTVSPGVGTATCTTTSLPQGTDSITAVFTPTSNSYAASTSGAVGVTVREASTTTVFSFSSSSITYGDEGIEVVSVNVSPEFAGSTPAGTVRVSDSRSTLCEITLSGAKGSCSLSAAQLGVGSYSSLTASYAGNSDFAGSSSSTTESLTVAPASSTTTLSTSAAKVAYGHESAEELSVRVRSRFSGSTPTGRVRVSDSRATLCRDHPLGRSGYLYPVCEDPPRGRLQPCGHLRREPRFQLLCLYERGSHCLKGDSERRPQAVALNGHVRPRNLRAHLRQRLARVRRFQAQRRCDGEDLFEDALCDFALFFWQGLVHPSSGDALGGQL